MEAFVYLSIFGITAALLAIFDFLLEKHQEEDWILKYYKE